MKHRQQKREEAETRQKVYDALTHKQRLDLIVSRRGDSKKETLRLMVAVDMKKGRHIHDENTSNQAVSKGKRVKKG